MLQTKFDCWHSGRSNTKYDHDQIEYVIEVDLYELSQWYVSPSVRFLKYVLCIYINRKKHKGLSWEAKI